MTLNRCMLLINFLEWRSSVSAISCMTGFTRKYHWALKGRWCRFKFCGSLVFIIPWYYRGQININYCHNLSRIEMEWTVIKGWKGGYCLWKAGVNCCLLIANCKKGMFSKVLVLRSIYGLSSLPVKGSITCVSLIFTNQLLIHYLQNNDFGRCIGTQLL